MTEKIERTRSPKGSFKKHSPQMKTHVLRILENNGGNLKKTVEQTGVSAQTIRKWRDLAAPFEKDGETRRPLAERLEETAHQAIDVLQKKLKSPKASVGDISRAMELAVRAKRQLDNNLPPPPNLSQEETLRRLTELYRQSKESRGGSPLQLVKNEDAEQTQTG